jgi:hypothetical protein
MAISDHLELVNRAIASGVLGHIQWKESAARLVRCDPNLAGLTPEGMRALLRQFVLEGNSLEVRRETRIEYLEDNPEEPYWYRALIPVHGFPRVLFLEVRLVDDDPEVPWVEIVSAHLQ